MNNRDDFLKLKSRFEKPMENSFLSDEFLETPTAKRHNQHSLVSLGFSHAIFLKYSQVGELFCLQPLGVGSLELFFEKWINYRN